jgi:hypothetical protein
MYNPSIRVHSRDEKLNLIIIIIIIQDRIFFDPVEGSDMLLRNIRRSYSSYSVVRTSNPHA